MFQQKMSKEELANNINEVAKINGDFFLRSGIRTDTYFDKYLFESKPYLLLSIAEYMKEILPSDFDKLAGLEMGGIPIATALSLTSHREVLFVRKKAKDYGTKKIAEGGDINNQSLVIIEDIVSSGGAVIDAITELRKEGAVISKVLCVIDRETGGRENIEKLGVEFESIFTRTQIENS